MCIIYEIGRVITASSSPVISSHNMPLALVILIPRGIKGPMIPCACVVIPFILDVRLVDAPAEVTQEEGHTEFLHLPSAVLALIFSREKDSAVPFPRRP